MKRIKTKKYRLSFAKHCFVVSEGRLVDMFRTKYGRGDLGIKVFDLEEVREENDFYSVKWGDDPRKDQPRKNTKLWEATQIQNIMSMHGLAPRVCGLETISLADKLVPVQLIQLLEHKGDTTQDEAQALYTKVITLGETYNFGVEKEDVSKADVMNGNQLVDFQTLAFSEPYEEYVKQAYIEQGRYGKVYYQDVPELGLRGGPRKSEQRIKELGLDRIKFGGKDVWDIGCAGGFFTRYASDKNAKIVTGFDFPEPIAAARHLANYLGYFNIDYVEDVDFRKTTPFGSNRLVVKPDIVFFLSMNLHIGIPSWILDAPMVIFEDNGKESRKKTELGKPWTDHFDKIEFIGKATDHGNKPIYHLQKTK